MLTMTVASKGDILVQILVGTSAQTEQVGGICANNTQAGTFETNKRDEKANADTDRKH